MIKKSISLLRLSTHLLKGLWIVMRNKRLNEDGCPYADFDGLSTRWQQELCHLLDLTIIVQGTPSQAGTLLVANHISWLDIPALGGQTPISFLSKAEVAHWPLIGRLAKAGGTLFIERGKQGAAKAAREAMTARLACPQSLLIFPEGRTTDGTDVQKFYSRLLAASQERRSPIQAVAIKYVAGNGQLSSLAPFINGQSFLSHLWRFLDEDSTRVEITFLPPIPYPEQGDPKHLATTLREEIRQSLYSTPLTKD